MKLSAVIGLSCLISILILIILVIVFGLSFKNRYNNLFSTNFLMRNGYCKVIDDNGTPIITDSGSLFGIGGIYSKEYCSLNPLILTDNKFRENALAKYDLNQLYTFIMNVFSGKQKLPDQNLINTDPILSSMILNPWYTSDDSYFTSENIYYTFDLRTFKINDTIYTSFNNDGLYLSWYDELKSLNINTGDICSPLEKTDCENYQFKCQCQNDIVRTYYLYMDNNLILDLPAQLYLGKLSNSDIGKETVRLSKNNTPLQPLRINNLSDLENLLENRFYKFRNKVGNSCEFLLESKQKEKDSFCKFFTSSSLSGLVIVLRRILINNISDNVIEEYIQKINKKMSRNQSLDYLQFFLWLAAKSKFDKVNYKFILYKK